MANFTCAIRNDSLGAIRWRIGALSEYCSGDSIVGTGLHIMCSTIRDNSKRRETIGIVATADLDGTPVECMVDSFAGVEHDEYSKFALLKVSPANTTMNGTTQAQSKQSIILLNNYCANCLKINTVISFILLAALLFCPATIIQSLGLQAHLELVQIAAHPSAVKCPLAGTVVTTRHQSPATSGRQSASL